MYDMLSDEDLVDLLSMEIELDSDSLWSKSGFHDGDILDQYWPVIEFHPDSDKDPHGEEHRVLMELVRTKLLPLLPEPAEVMEIVSIHNPIRAVDYGRLSGPPFPSVSVTITADDVLEARTRLRENA